MCVEGYVEGLHDGFLRGWARYTTENARSVRLDVMIGEKRLTTIDADIYREDLESAGVGSGKYGFEYKVPDSILKDDHYFVVRLHGGEEQVEPLPSYHPQELSIPRISCFGLLKSKRIRYSKKYIHGAGIEIGALHNPMPVPGDADVKYVDRMNNADLRKQYPELRNLRLVPVHYVCDGQALDAIGNKAYDFVVANHFLEHAENPISAIENMLRVLKVGGVLFITIPDKKSTFDKERPSTSFEHLVEDYKQGPEISREKHYIEWVKYVVGKEDPDEIKAEVKGLMEQNYSIHYHVWSFGDMAKMVSSMREDLGFKFKIEVESAAMHEAIFVLKKT